MKSNEPKNSEQVVTVLNLDMFNQGLGTIIPKRKVIEPSMDDEQQEGRSKGRNKR